MLFFSSPFHYRKFNFLFFICCRKPHMFSVLSGKDKAWERKQSRVARGHSLFHLPKPSSHLCPRYFRFYHLSCAVHQLSKQPVSRQKTSVAPHTALWGAKRDLMFWKCLPTYNSSVKSCLEAEGSEVRKYLQRKSFSVAHCFQKEMDKQQASVEGVEEGS